MGRKESNQTSKQYILQIQFFRRLYPVQSHVSILSSLLPPWQTVFVVARIIILVDLHILFRNISEGQCVDINICGLDCYMQITVKKQ